jgi:hypothetical protein
MDMTLIDREGRVFGRFNLVDAAVAAFILLLLPVAYATFLLFRPSRPVIDSVTRVEITNEERRVTGGSLLTAKLKIKGHGFSPLLRARIGSLEASGFVFESPNSADVLVGLLPPGKHDLVLYDGVQEVARARDAVEITSQATDGPSVRLYGWITDLNPEQANAFTPLFASHPDEANAFRIVALGPVLPARTRVVTGTQVADIRVPGKVERAAEILVRCDRTSSAGCTIGGKALNEIPISVSLPGLLFEIDEIAPPDEPRPAVATVQLAAPIAGIRTGDRDAVVSTSAAEVTAIAGNRLTLKLGVHESREGWRYRGRLLSPGAPLTLRTGSYTLTGTVTSVQMSQ